jgi:hypothetical protein
MKLARVVRLVGHRVIDDETWLTRKQPECAPKLSFLCEQRIGLHGPERP